MQNAHASVTFCFVFFVFFYVNSYSIIYTKRIVIDSFTLQLSSSEFSCNQQVLHFKVLATDEKAIVYHISLENVCTLVSCTWHFSLALVLYGQSQCPTHYSNLCRPYFVLSPAEYILAYPHSLVHCHSPFEYGWFLELTSAYPECKPS